MRIKPVSTFEYGVSDYMCHGSKKEKERELLPCLQASQISPDFCWWALWQGSQITCIVFSFVTLTILPSGKAVVILVIG